MEKFKSQEALLVWIINFFAEKFTTHAILKGGMCLRLLDCPRYTNDVDYVFVPFSSKRKIKEMILTELKSVAELKVSVSINSKCIKYIIEYNGQQAAVEVNVNIDCPYTDITSTDLSRGHNQLGGIVRIMDFSISLANKLAAWNERRIIRDLYDAWFIHIMLKTDPDMKTLNSRLGKVESRLKPKIKSITLNEFQKELRDALKNLNEKKIEAELKDVLAKKEMVGLYPRMLSGLSRLVENLI